MIQFELNGEPRQSQSEPDTPLLWVLRDELGLTGTRFGCGKGLCGACTVHLDGVAVRSCSLPLQSIAGRAITTIEALAGEHPLQRAWIEFNVPQCGYCQSGQIMSAAALLASEPRPDREQVRTAMAGNICRCGSYNKIYRAIAAVVESTAAESTAAESTAAESTAAESTAAESTAAESTAAESTGIESKTVPVVPTEGAAEISAAATAGDNA